HGKPPRLLGDVEHMLELNAGAWKVGYWTHHLAQSLKVLIEEGKQVVFGKRLRFLISGRVIVEDETGTVVQGLRFWSAILGVVLTIRITAMAASASTPRLFTSLDTNVEQSAVWYQMREGCHWRIVSHTGD
ncbi:MAG: hypothetical protein L0K63_11865, partial [Yaniella sp.]|nr:hypothetical protein [Yaniella sp.]